MSKRKIVDEKEGKESVAAQVWKELKGNAGKLIHVATQWCEEMDDLESQKIFLQEVKSNGDWAQRDVVKNIVAALEKNKIFRLLLQQVPLSKTITERLCSYNSGNICVDDLRNRYSYLCEQLEPRKARSENEDEDEDDEDLLIDEVPIDVNNVDDNLLDLLIQ